MNWGPSNSSSDRKKKIEEEEKDGEEEEEKEKEKEEEEGTGKVGCRLCYLANLLTEVEHVEECPRDFVDHPSDAPC